MALQEIMLDRRVRDWVMLPLVFAVFMMRLLTQYLFQIVGQPPENNGKDQDKIRQQQLVKRAQRLRVMGHYIPESSYRMRKAFFIAKETGALHDKPEKASGADLMADPSALMGPMKRQLLGYVPQVGLGALVNFFFDGFVLGKVPLPLSPRFRPMLQRGIDLGSLDVSYFTSLSLYILLVFSLRGVLSLMFHDSVFDETEMMRRQMTGGAAQPGFDPAKAFDQERAAMEVADHKFRHDDVEQRAIAVLQAKLRSV